MAYDLEEQEQIDAIKGWWSENGTLVIIAILACFLTIAAFQGWRYYRAQQSERVAFCSNDFSKIGQRLLSEA